MWAMQALMKDSQIHIWTKAEKDERTAKEFFDQYIKDDPEMYIVQDTSIDWNLFHRWWFFFDSVFHAHPQTGRHHFLREKFMQAIDRQDWRVDLIDALRGGSIEEYSKFDSRHINIKWKDVFSDPAFALYFVNRARRIVAMIESAQNGNPPITIIESEAEGVVYEQRQPIDVGSELDFVDRYINEQVYKPARALASLKRVAGIVQATSVGGGPLDELKLTECDGALFAAQGLVACKRDLTEEEKAARGIMTLNKKLAFEKNACIMLSKLLPGAPSPHSPEVIPYDHEASRLLRGVAPEDICRP